jgi:hypothetical protein
MGLGHSHYPVPWSALKYDTSLSGFRTNISEQQLKTLLKSAITTGVIGTGKRAPTNTTGRRSNW